MNYLSTIATLFALLLGSVGSMSAAEPKLKGSKVIITRMADDLDLTGVTAIDASRSVNVEVVEKDAPLIEISANDNLMEYVELRIVNGTLIATLSEGLGPVRKTKINIKVPYNEEFMAFKASSGSQIVSSQFMHMPTLDLAVTSAGKIKIDAAVDKNCLINAQAAGKIELHGRVAGNCYVKTQSSASVRMTISTNELNVDASGSSKIDVDGNVEYLTVRTASSATYTGEMLKAQNGDLSASSSSKIIYFGINNFVTNTSSSGTITNTKFLNE